MLTVTPGDHIDPADSSTDASADPHNSHSRKVRTENVAGGLYDGFEAYRTPSAADYHALLTNGMIVLDANVLVDLYRYHTRTRNEFLTVLENLKDLLWFPHQVVKEFWNARDNIITDPMEVDKTASELRKHLAGADRDLRHWAKRVRLPENYSQELVAIISEAFKKVVEQVEQLAVNDGREFAYDTNGDPLIASLEPILKFRVGPPFEPDVYERALKEAQRRGNERIPPGYMDMGKEGAGPAGDYLVWAQLLKEAQKQQRDVLFVTSDNKEDWWRKNKSGESLGPRPELAEELRNATGGRLFILPPDNLLNRAREELNIQVSEESVQDVKQTSRMETASLISGESYSSGFHRAMDYEQEIRLALMNMGYEVTHGSIDSGFDFLVADAEQRAILAELKYSRSSKFLSGKIVERLRTLAKPGIPVLLISNMPLSSSAEWALREPTLLPPEEEPMLDYIIWQGPADYDGLKAKLADIFARLP